MPRNLNAANANDISITATGGASGGQYGIQAVDYGNGNINVEAAGAISSSALQGIRTQSLGTGSTAVTTDAGTTINSDGSGINIVNSATAIAASAHSSLTLTTGSGTITAGATHNLSGSAPDGIVVGYFGANATANTAINGTVVINNGANVTEPFGAAVQGYNYGNGDVTVNELANTIVSGLVGVLAFGESGGTGNVAVSVGTAATVTATGTSSTASVPFGIEAYNRDSGNVSVTMASGDIVNAAGTGMIGVLAASASTTISLGDTVQVIAHGSITSGAEAINAGYYPGTNTVEPNVAGDVIVQSDATLNAGGYGIRAYNWGIGNVSVTAGATSSIVAAGFGIIAGSSGLSVPAGNSVQITAHGTIQSGLDGIRAYYDVGGTNQPNVTVAGNIVVQSDANIVTASGNGIGAFNWGVGNVSVTTGSTSSITSTGSGINAGSDASALAAGQSVTVTAAGTIHSGSNGINAFINNGGTNQPSNTVAGDIVIHSSATIVTTSGPGIGAYNWGIGNVAITTDATSSIAAGGTFNGIGANAYDGGTVNVTNAGAAMGNNGLFASAVLAGNISIENDGQLTGTAFAGISLAQNAAGATGSTTITNTGSVTANVANQDAIFVNGNSTGSLTITNTGTIGSNAVAASTTAIGYLGGGAVVINNNSGGVINGSISTSNNGFTGTLYNNAGATWQAGYVDDEGTITASGAGSVINFLGVTGGSDVGYAGNGHLTLEAGAALTADFLNVGHLFGSNGTVVVTGAGTTVDTRAGQYQNIEVGFDGIASFTIASQAVVSTTYMGIANGFDAGVIDTLDVNDATLNVGQYLTIANAGMASVTIESGGTLNSLGIGIAYQAGSTGTLVVTGAGTIINTTAQQFQNINVGTDGTASLMVSNHAVVNADNVASAINHDAGVIDTIDINDATVNATTSFSVAGSGTANAIVENGGVINTANLYDGEIIGSSGGVGTLTVTGVGSIVNVTNFFGLSSANSSGTVTVSQGGSIDIGLNTSSIANAIHLAGTGSLQGFGTINADVVNDNYLAVSAGEALKIMGAVSGSGYFGIGTGAQLELGSTVASSDHFTFQDTTGTLRLDDPSHFSGQIFGLSGSDAIDLMGFVFASTTITPNSTSTSTVLTITDATHTVANGTAAQINLQGDYRTSTFTTSDDGHGGVVIVDPPATSSTNPAFVQGTSGNDVIVATGGSDVLTGFGGQDQFVFAPASTTAAHIITDYMPGSDQIDIRQFTNISAIPTYTQQGNDTLITLDANDTVLLKNVLAAALHASDFLLHA